MTDIYYGVLAFVALASLLFAAYKLRPESTRIFVDSAKVSVELANSDRADLIKRMDAMEARLNKAEAAAAAATRRAEQAEAQLGQAREKVRKLAVMVGALRREMQANGISVPDHLADDLDFDA